MDQAAALGKRLNLSYPLIADPELRIIRSFGVEMAGQPIAVPSTFVLEARTGRVVWRYIGESPFDRSDLQAILAAIGKAGGQRPQDPSSAKP
jgi:peroxiredoxin